MSETGVPADGPECGRDFCDACGDCLACYGGDPCWPRHKGPHLWVRYGDKNETLFCVDYPSKEPAAGAPSPTSPPSPPAEPTK